MAYQPIVTVQISLETSAVQRASFGTIMFIEDHMWFKERSRSYTSLTGAADDFPTDSDSYTALQQAFGVIPAPRLVKIGRREAADFTITPDAITTIGQQVSVSVLDTADTVTTATFTSTTGAETPTAVSAALTTALGTPAGVTVTDNTGTVTLTRSGSDDFAVTNISGATHATTTTETAADMMAAITLENDDFYFVACNDKSDAFIQALATDVEARIKLYFTSVSDVTNLAVYSEVATDTMSCLLYTSPSPRDRTRSRMPSSA